MPALSSGTVSSGPVGGSGTGPGTTTTPTVGFGPSCGCSCKRCKFTVGTGWCTTCIATTTITVTIRRNDASGAVVSTGTADPTTGIYTWIPPSSGTYYFEASAAGYLNQPSTVTINTTTCTPKSAGSMLYPATLTLTDSIAGSCVLSPSGSHLFSTGNPFRYIGTITFPFPGACGCAAGSVTLYYAAVFCGYQGGVRPDLIVWLPDQPYDAPGFGWPYSCPGGMTAFWTSWSLSSPTGSGPQMPTCSVVNLNWTGLIAQSSLVPSAVAAMYGICADAVPIFGNYTVTL